MLVRELIEKLQSMPQDAEVHSVAKGNDGYYQQWMESQNIYVGHYPIEAEWLDEEHKNSGAVIRTSIVFVCGAESLIREVQFGEELPEYDRRRIFDGHSVPLYYTEKYTSKEEGMEWDYPVYRHYPYTPNAIGGDNYIDCCFPAFHAIFAGEN